MDINSITQAITTVGFPIAMCIMMAWYIKSIQFNYREDVKSLQQTVDNNTKVLERIVDRLEDIEHVKRD